MGTSGSAPRAAALHTGPVYERNAAVMFFDRVRRSPDRVAVAQLHGPTYTYAELGRRLAATVESLRRCGVGRGDRVAYAGANRSELFEHLVAALHLGAVFVPLNIRLSPSELRFIVNDAGARVLVADEGAAALFATVRGEMAVERWLLVAGAPSEAGEASGPVLDGWEPAGTVDPADDPVAVALGLGPPVDVDPDEVAVVMYTSGTTGLPKGAMISHGNVVGAVHNLMLLVPMGPSAGLLNMAPMFHIGALALTLGALATGGRVVILAAFDPAAVFDALEVHPITFSFGVPAMLRAMTVDPRFEQADLSNLFLMCAGAPVPESLLHRYLERGAQVTQGYGLTESTGVVSLLESDRAARKLGSAGMPFPLTAVELRDADGRRVETAGIDGEIWIKGRTAVQGYWNRPDDTAALVDGGGWLRTGDAGRFDADGFLYITDRVKDMLITGGENVYPAEVEKVLAGHPDVADVAVIGTPDARWGEVVTAVVVPRPGAGSGMPDLDALQAHARRQLGGYKVPRRLHVVGELPRNAAGKVLKRELRARLASSDGNDANDANDGHGGSDR